MTDLAVIAVCPYMYLISCAYELDANAHLVPIAPNAALQYVVHAQFPCNLLHALGGALVGHGGRACDHTQLVWAQCPELVIVFGESVAEIVFIWISAKIFERQDSQHGLMHGGCAGTTGSPPSRTDKEKKDQGC